MDILDDLEPLVLLLSSHAGSKEGRELKRRAIAMIQAQAALIFQLENQLDDAYREIEVLIAAAKAKPTEN